MINDELLSKLITTIEESNKRTIEEANTQQTEIIKQHIKHEISEINAKFEAELNQKSIEFENKCKELKVRYSKLEKELKKNNIIIFDLDTPSEKLADFVVSTLNKYLGLQLTINDIDNVYRIGKQTNKRPIIVKLLSYLKKQEILRNGKKLKGTNISVAQELTFEERKENKILRQHLNEARAKDLNAFIKNKKLVINGQEYSAKDLADEEEDTDNEEATDKKETAEDIVFDTSGDTGIRQHNSAPPTPTVTYEEIQTEDERKEEEVFETEKVGDSRKRKTVKVIQPVNKIARPSRTNSNKESKRIVSVDMHETPIKNKKPVEKF